MRKILCCLALFVFSQPITAGDFFSPDGNVEVWAEKPDGYLTPEEWLVLHPPPAPLPLSLVEAKQFKKTAIDANTNRIRDRDGLAYADQRFAMNEGAMVKWAGLLAAKDILPFPMTILTIDDKPFVLADQAALMQFVAAVLGYETFPDSPLATGRTLRARVEAAQTVEEVDAIIDERD